MIIIILVISFNSVNAVENNELITNESTEMIKLTNEVDDYNYSLKLQNNSITLKDTSYDLESNIINANDGDEILINPGTYHLHNITLTKNIVLKGNGHPEDIIIDGEEKSSIFMIRNDAVHVTFKNLTFINANTEEFGGAISIETGHVYVDNCNFINNTAGVNAGGISNYGSEKIKGYLLVNNSLFVNNHAYHDGGAITTCYANSDIYNCVFIGNSANRDGGAIRVSVQGYGNVQDCIFMYNHADEWGGAYYSWSGTSNIIRCIFMNNTAGTNGGAVMVSGDLNLENSIIMNNNGGKTGGSFYIQQPMYNEVTSIDIHNNLITNNSSPKGQEIFIKWKDTINLYTDFNDNDWGDENPNDSSVIDPNNVTTRSKVTSTIKSNLLNILNLNLLTKYTDLIKDYFPEDYLDNIKKQSESNESNEYNYQNNTNTNNHKETIQKTINNINYQFRNQKINNNDIIEKTNNTNSPNLEQNMILTNNNQSTIDSNINSNAQIIIGNSTSYGENKKAYELNETTSVAKQSNVDFKYFIIIVVTIFILLAIGYKRKKEEEQ